MSDNKIVIGRIEQLGLPVDSGKDGGGMGISEELQNQSHELLNKIRKTHYGYGVTDTLKKIEKFLGGAVFECDGCGEYDYASNARVKENDSGAYCETCAEKVS